MKTRWLIAMAAVALPIGLYATVQSEARPQQPDDRFRSQRDQLAYGLGLYLGEEVRQGLATDGIELSSLRVLEGFRDGLTGREPALPREELDLVLVAVHKEMKTRMVRRLLAEDPNFKKLHDENLERSIAYLEENEKREGVRVLPGGVQYEVIASGNGPTPQLGDRLIVNYTVWHIDGTQAASASGHQVVMGEHVLEGTAIMLAHMKVGDNWRVVLPPSLAFGPAGDPPMIGPNEALVGEVELVEIESR